MRLILDIEYKNDFDANIISNEKLKIHLSECFPAYYLYQKRNLFDWDAIYLYQKLNLFD